MTEKKPKAPPRENNPTSKQDQRKPEGKAADRPHEPTAVDRPGFDLGGSTGQTSAGTSLGIGKDSSENRNDRRLPGRPKNNN